MSTVTPKIFIVGQTAVDTEGMQDAITAMGSGAWAVLDDSFDISDPALLTEYAGKGCYMSFDTLANKNLTRAGTRDTHTYVGEQILATGHGSVLEHSTVSIQFVDVSRILTHELVRHRAGSAFSQVSGRYVRGEIRVWLPTCISECPELTRVALLSIAQAREIQAEFERISGIDQIKDFKRKKILTSAFRRFAPGGLANHILATFNHRAWRHLIQLRTHESAEEEIRLVFGMVAEHLSTRYPEIYQDMQFKSVNGLNQYWFTNPKV